MSSVFHTPHSHCATYYCSINKINSNANNNNKNQNGDCEVLRNRLKGNFSYTLLWLNLYSLYYIRITAILIISLSIIALVCYMSIQFIPALTPLKPTSAKFNKYIHTLRSNSFWQISQFNNVTIPPPSPPTDKEKEELVET